MLDVRQVFEYIQRVPEIHIIEDVNSPVVVP